MENAKNTEATESTPAENGQSEGSGAEKRIMGLIAENAKLRDKLAGSITTSESQQVKLDNLANRLNEVEKAQVEEVPLPGDDADAHDVVQWAKAEMAKREEQFAQQIAQVTTDQQVQRVREANSDFDELRTEFYNKFESDPELASVIRNSENPPLEFYTRAKRMKALIDGHDLTNEVAREDAKGSALGMSPTPVENEKIVEATDEDFARANRIFPGMYKTKKDLAEAVLKEQNIKRKW